MKTTAMGNKAHNHNDYVELYKYNTQTGWKARRLEDRKEDDLPDTGDGGTHAGRQRCNVKIHREEAAEERNLIVDTMTTRLVVVVAVFLVLLLLYRHERPQ